MKLLVRTFFIVIIISLIINDILAQNVHQYLQKTKEFNKSVKSMETALDIMSKNFVYYNQADKEVANNLLDEILNLSSSLKNPRNEFLYSVYIQLDSIQRSIVKKRIATEIQPHDFLYNELVSLYDLKGHYYRILSLIDTNLIDQIKIEFVSKGTISDNKINNLKYITTLANIGINNKYENELLSLIKYLYSTSKNIDDKFISSMMLITLYNKIVPNTIGKLLSKNSIVKSLYLMDEESRLSFDFDVSDNNLAWKYLLTCVLNKLKYADEKYWNPEEFYKNIDKIKRELQSSDSIWLNHIKTKNQENH